MSGAKVELRVGSVKVDETTTDANGAYTLIELLDGLTYRVTPVASGKTFTPSYADVTVNNGNVSGKNFTEVAQPPQGNLQRPLGGPIASILKLRLQAGQLRALAMVSKTSACLGLLRSGMEGRPTFWPIQAGF